MKKLIIIYIFLFTAIYAVVHDKLGLIGAAPSQYPA